MTVFPNREEESEGRKEREREKIKLYKCTFAPLLSLGAHLQEETKRKGEALGCDHKSTSHTITPASPAYIPLQTNL